MYIAVKFMSDSNNLQPEETILTLREASSLLKCHPNTLRKWDKNGSYQLFKVNNLIIFHCILEI